MNLIKKSHTDSFTLIELLIVVAIIGILAAIAVPNFVNGLLKAKIARSYADMRSVCTAIRTFQMDRGLMLVDCFDQQTDWGRKRIEKEFHGVGRGTGEYGARSWLDVLAPITTPVSYMSSVPIDPFHNVEIQRERNSIFKDYVDTPHYCYVDDDPEDPGYDHGMIMFYPESAQRYGNQPMLTGDFLLMGMGPDGINSPPDMSIVAELVPIRYDMSNGLNSWGDIIMR